MDIKKLTVGIEEEYQVIDPDTGEVPVDSKGRRSYSTSMSLSLIHI